jgi:hypothetical protein
LEGCFIAGGCAAAQLLHRAMAPLLSHYKSFSKP